MEDKLREEADERLASTTARLEALTSQLQAVEARAASDALEAQHAMRALADENAALRAENAALKKQVQDMSGRLGELQLGHDELDAFLDGDVTSSPGAERPDRPRTPLADRPRGVSESGGVRLPSLEQSVDDILDNCGAVSLTPSQQPRDFADDEPRAAPAPPVGKAAVTPRKKSILGGLGARMSARKASQDAAPRE